MRIHRGPIALVGVLAAIVAMTVGIAPQAAAALPTCTNWSYTSVPGVEDGYAKVPSVGYLTGQISCQLQQGDYNNTAVAVLQWLSLNTCHGKGLNVDGDYGPLTRAAVEDLQRRAGITPDGVYGPNTRVLALRWAAFRGPGGEFIGCRRVA